MILQNQLDFIPGDAIELSPHLAIIKQKNNIIFFNSTTPIYSCQESDKIGIRIAAVIMANLKLASVNSLSEQLNINRTTIFRNRIKFKKDGIKSLIDSNRKQKPHKLKEDVIKKIEELLSEGKSIRKAAKEFNISEGAIRYQIKQGKIRKLNNKLPSEPDKKQEELSGPGERVIIDQSNLDFGMGVKRVEERMQAKEGSLEKAKVLFIKAEAVPMAGVLLALPFILKQGLIDIGEKVYKKLSNGYYGLCSVLLVLCFMALLRIKSIEQLRQVSPGETGILIGLDRAPEAKTLRKKVKELGERKLVSEFKGELLQHWARMSQERIGMLYIDGHVRPYNGKKHKLPKTHVARRRLCMPATTDFWVNDKNNEPIFFVTAEANNSLLSMIDKEILPEIREVVREDERITIIFDREGWSPNYFKKWKEQKIDIITYRKGKYDMWPENCFIPESCVKKGKKVEYKLGERSVKINDIWVREVRRLCDNGHQTSIITTRQDLLCIEIATSMFKRWGQENYFRYMRHEYNLDHLCTYAVEKANPHRLVSNPEKKEKTKELKALEEQMKGLERQYGIEMFNSIEANTFELEKFKEENENLYSEIKVVLENREKIKSVSKKMPNKVEIRKIKSEEKIVALEKERKTFCDLIKMIAYRAETGMSEMLIPYFSRHDDEVRSFLKKLFQIPADIIPNYELKQLKLRYHCMQTNHEQELLRKLCAINNEKEIIFPGTNLRLVYEVL